MAYVSTSAALRKVIDAGLYSGLASGANISLGGNGVFSYCSTHTSTEVIATGFFAGCGAQILPTATTSQTTGTPHPNIWTRSGNNVGVRVGDLVCNIESSGGVTPGRVTWHAAKASTFSGSTSSFSATAGYDITVSAAAT
jgi:hypothetical protein